MNYSFPGLLSSHRCNCQSAGRDVGRAGTQEWGRSWGWEAGEGRMEKTEIQKFLNTREDFGDIWSSFQRQQRPGMKRLEPVCGHRLLPSGSPGSKTKEFLTPRVHHSTLCFPNLTVLMAVIRLGLGCTMRGALCFHAENHS